MRELVDGPPLSKSTNQNFVALLQNNNNKEKCPSVVDNRSLHSNELFIAMVGSQTRHDFHESSLNPQGLIGGALSKSDE